KVPNLNADQVDGADWASPAAIGSTTPAAGTFTTLAANTSFAVGGGAAIIKHLSATASLDFASVAANSCSDLTITVTGAANGDSVALGVPGALASTAGLVFTGFVSAANTVTVRACNVATAASANPAAATVRADIWK